MAGHGHRSPCGFLAAQNQLSWSPGNRPAGPPSAPGCCGTVPDPSPDTGCDLTPPRGELGDDRSPSWDAHPLVLPVAPTWEIPAESGDQEAESINGCRPRVREPSSFWSRVSEEQAGARRTGFDEVTRSFPTYRGSACGTQKKTNNVVFLFVFNISPMQSNFSSFIRRCQYEVYKTCVQRNAVVEK